MMFKSLSKNKGAIIFSICLIIVIFVAFLPRSTPSEVVKVSGSDVVCNGNSIKLKGFSLLSNDVFTDWAMSITLERMQQIKWWGFNTVNINVWWGYHIECYQDQVDVYNEINLKKIENIIEFAAQAELYVILSISVSQWQHGGYPDWQGWPREYMFVDNQYDDAASVRQRFYNMWAMLIERFDKYNNLVGYNWWAFPWHIRPWDDRISEETEVYYNEITPNLLNITRSLSDKIIFFTPYKQGSHSPINGTNYDSSEYAFIVPIADDNVIYCFGFHKPLDVERTSQIKYDKDGNRIPWDYDIDYLKRQLKNALEFRKKYNVPMMVTEMGMYTHDYPDVKETGDIAQDRLDCYDAKLSLLDEYGWSWVYLAYSNRGAEGVLKQQTYDPYKIVDVLRNHTQ